MLLDRAASFSSRKVYSGPGVVEWSSCPEEEKHEEETHPMVSVMEGLGMCRSLSPPYNSTSMVSDRDPQTPSVLYVRKPRKTFASQCAEIASGLDIGSHLDAITKSMPKISKLLASSARKPTIAISMVYGKSRRIYIVEGVHMEYFEGVLQRLASQAS